MLSFRQGGAGRLATQASRTDSVQTMLGAGGNCQPANRVVSLRSKVTQTDNMVQIAEQQCCCNCSQKVS